MSADVPVRTGLRVPPGGRGPRGNDRSCARPPARGPVLAIMGGSSGSGPLT